MNILASCGGSPRVSWPEVQEYGRETLTRGAANHSRQVYCACWDGVTTKWTRLGKGFKLRGAPDKDLSRMSRTCPVWGLVGIGAIAGGEDGKRR